MMQINKQSSQNTYEIIFLMVSVLLVFMDAYQIFGIPIPWLGMTLLLLFALTKYRLFYNSKNLVIVSILIAIVMIPQIIYIFFNEVSQGEIQYLFLRLLNIFSFVIVLLFSVTYFRNEKIMSFYDTWKYLIGVMSALNCLLYTSDAADE